MRAGQAIGLLDRKRQIKKKKESSSVSRLGSFELSGLGLGEFDSNHGEIFQMCPGGLPAKPAKALLLVLQVTGLGPFEIIRLLCDVRGWFVGVA